jgi:hypothetical protein
MIGLGQLIPLVVAVGVPALIGFLVPRRWRLWALALWILAPLLIVLVLAASEIASGKANPADLDKLVYGVLLIGSFVAAPWMIACGVGYALGAMLRGRAPSAAMAADPPLPAPTQRPSADPDVSTPPPPDRFVPTLSPPSGWDAAHVGFGHDDLVLGGLPVWSLPWRREPSGPVMLAHPAHPSQQHAFTIYSIDDGTRATRFAAAELSNGVWGFYRWIVPADAPSGTSADGTLRFEHDLGSLENGRYDAIAPVARLSAARTGALLFDGAAWFSSRIVPQADGSLLLALEHRQQQSIFRIDPVRCSFRDLAEPASERPLVALADAAAAARAACDDPSAGAGRRTLSMPPPGLTARNWLVALAILAGAVSLIAVATLVTLRVQGDQEPRRLDTIPPMPSER